MKKIYTIIGALAISTASFAQSNALYNFGVGSKLTPIKAKSAQSSIKNKTSNVAGGVISMRVDPMFNVFTSRSGSIGGGIASFYSELNCDSLLKLGVDHVNTHMAGITFDAQSISQGPNTTPLFLKADAFTIDTLWFGGIYDRVTGPSIVDTLIVDVAWGDTTATAVFTKYAFPAANAPLDKFGSIIAPKFAVATPTAHGLQARLANQANYIRYKVLLNVADTNDINNVSGYMGYKLPTALAIPAGNKVAISYTYRAGTTYTLGQVYSGAGQTVNGWRPTLYSQSPQPTSNAGILDYFNDLGVGKNQGTAMYSNQRYGLIGSGFVQTSAMYSQFSSGYMIDISLHGTSTVGLSELEKNGFELGQNVPNPFTSNSSIKYQLAKDAKAVVFTLTDVTGRIVSTETASSTTGVHTINVGSLASGIYYYSLNVDGNTVTKKMIAQ